MVELILIWMIWFKEEFWNEDASTFKIYDALIHVLCVFEASLAVGIADVYV